MITGVIETQKTVRTIEGRVVSNKMKDTIVVVIERRVKHARYGKIISRTTKIHAHDPGNKCSIGDIVRVQESRPISKTKCWILLEIKNASVSGDSL